MDLFDIVNQQIDAVRLPLYAVTVTAAARADTPLIAILHWHGLLRETPLALPGIDVPPRPVPGSAIQFERPGPALESVEAMLLDAAWRLGAWELERVERRACNTLGASAGEALVCRQAFGDYGDYGAGACAERHLVDGAPERDALMQLAAAKATRAGCSVRSRAASGARSTNPTTHSMRTAAGSRRARSRRGRGGRRCSARRLCATGWVRCAAS